MCFCSKQSILFYLYALTSGGKQKACWSIQLKTSLLLILTNFTSTGLPELTVSDFSRLALSDFGWIHFEGRNVENVAVMAEMASRGRVRISVEVEKLGRRYDDILPHVDTVFVSKEYSMSKGAREQCCKTFFLKKNGPTLASFSYLFLVFSNKQYNFDHKSM